jgi:hypothetical protein
VARKTSRSKSNGSAPKTKNYDDYSIVDPKKIPDGPDLLVDVPVVKVDEINLEVKDLQAMVAVSANVRQLVRLNVGADVSLEKVQLKIEGVEAQALLKARLDNVTAILERVLTSLDRNPELIKSIGRAVEEVGGGAQRTLEGAGEAVEDVGEGGKGAVQQVGQGAGQAAGQIGQGAGDAVEQVGQGAGQGVQGAAQGVQQATGQLAQGGGQ